MEINGNESGTTHEYFYFKYKVVILFFMQQLTVHST